MESIAKETGKRIRSIRKKNGLTLEQLANGIGKCRSMVSKYETGAAVMDIHTLYEIADVLGVPTEELLYRKPMQKNAKITKNTENKILPFFNGESQFFGYYFDGRSQDINRTVFEVTNYIGNNQWGISVYMNYKDIENYVDCENTYRGILECYESISHIRVNNIGSPLEQLHISILSNFQDNNEKWGLMYGISSRPIMPISLKMYLSKTLVKEDDEFIKMLKISKFDISIMRQFNMFTVIPN